MKNMVKKNQIMITALAIMIAVAGYLNFAGGRITDEEIMATGTDSAVIADEAQMTQEDTEVASLFEISDEDMETAEITDIESMDSEVVTDQENYLEETMEEMMARTSDEAVEDQISDTQAPGEAVFTSSASLDTLSGAKLMKEQVRAKNKDTLMEIINNAELGEEEKKEAVNQMIALTDVAEKENAAETLLGAKGFADSVVCINGATVDVVVGKAELTDAQRAQIEDIVKRKTEADTANVVITLMDMNQ